MNGVTSGWIKNNVQDHSNKSWTSSSVINYFYSDPNGTYLSKIWTLPSLRGTKHEFFLEKN